MKNLTLAILLVFAMPLILVSCKGSQKQSNSTSDKKDTSSCDVVAKVVDYTGLSSCSILLELDDGTFLNPVEGFPRQEILRAEKVKISYTKLSGAVSSCMKGKLVNITCFKVIKKGVPSKGKFD